MEGGATGTSISAGGLLSVGANESAATLTVRATSTVDTSTSGTAAVTVSSSVTVSPSSPNVVKGQTQQFTATVSGNNNPAQTVTWTVEGGATGTSISAGGLLTVGANETASTLTVRATSTVDPSKFGTAIVKVYASADDLPTVTSVTVSPATATVAKGAAQQFTAAVSGTNNPAQTVTWTVEGGGDGTSISTGGFLTVGANETAAALTVRAASTDDPSKSGTATVTVSSGGQTSTITSVTVTPATTTVTKGGTRQFTAVINGNNTPAQTVTWTVEGGGNGTNIGTDGLLSVAANENASTLTVRAASTVDPGKSGTASVTVEGEVVKDIAGVQAYLSAASGGGTAADPVSLNVQLNLGDTSNGWAALLDAIQAAGKFVALDLSACTMSGNAQGVMEFDPGTANTGESKILSLVLPDEATSIKAGQENNPSFKNFTALTSVSGSAVETIGDYAFYNCKALTTVSFPAASSIGINAFAGCYALTEVSLPVASSIGDGAFGNCIALTEVSLPAASSIGGGAFAACDALTEVSLPAASSIGEIAFYNCAALTEVSLPAASFIGFDAFWDCTALTTVSLPASLATIYGNPFSGCRNLVTITVASGNPNYSAQGGMLLNKAGTSLIAYPGAAGAVTLNTVSSIGSEAFRGCTALTTVNLPAASSINSSAFAGCTALTTVSIPAASSIGNWAFDNTGTNDLTVTLGSTTPMLGYNMFYDINAAKTVTVKVPSNATEYGTLPSTYSGTDSAETWGNGFRGGGWDGAAFTGGSINSSITLTIQAE